MTDRSHEFGPPRRYVAITGPMSGTWISRACLHCNAFTLVSEEDPDGSLVAIAGALEIR
ncbi:MAG: hypothetical protein ACLPQY_09780 [Streptosporangiaceae bacterium]